MLLDILSNNSTEAKGCVARNEIPPSDCVANVSCYALRYNLNLL